MKEKGLRKVLFLVTVETWIAVDVIRGSWNQSQQVRRFPPGYKFHF